MSISEQIKKLRELAKDYSDWGIGIKRTDRILREAADTIESLSAKLTGMERKTEDCGGGWIYCGDGKNLPMEPLACIVTVIDTEPMTQTDFESILSYHVGYDGKQWNDIDGNRIPFEVIAWMYAPKKPYHEP